MTVQLELWHLITLLLAFFGCVGAFGKILIGQFEKRLNERFESQDKARETGSKALQDTLNQHLADERKLAAQMVSLERDFLTWKAELPLQYVRREDYVRNQTIIEAKLDSVALRIENLQLKGVANA